MKFIIERERLLKPLQQISSPFRSHAILPILNNVLLQVTDAHLYLTGTNFEIEIVAQVVLNDVHEPGAITVSARKFFDICRSFPEGVEITVTLEGERILICSERSRYSLSTLPASEFPNLDAWKSDVEFILPQSVLKKLIESTHFSMAHQDVRYYLNGMLFETESKELRTVATDGHRLAFCTTSVEEVLPSYSVIIPRKGIIELMRMLEDGENPVKLQIGRNNIRANVGEYIFTSKLINGCFPDYRRVLLKTSYQTVKVSCNVLKQAFSRAAILSNEKFRGVKLYLNANQLKITANNLEQEEAEEILDVVYHGRKIEISFNVIYLLDVLNALKCEEVHILLTDEMSSIEIKDSSSQMTSYVIMPMRL